MFIDCSNTLPEFLFDGSFGEDPNNINYLELFGPSWAKLAGYSQEKFKQEIKKSSIQNVMKNVFTKLQSDYSMDVFLNILEDSNIKYHGIHNMDYGRDGSEPPVDHDYIATILNKYPNQFFAYAGYNPHKGEKSLEVVKKAITKQGYKGVVIAPYEHGIKPDDEEYFPLYELCNQLEIPIWIHSSINYYKDTSIYIGHPCNLEKPLMKYKNLKIIAGHGGWPWLPDLIAMLLKYDNLYMDTSAFRPKYVAKPNTGWDMFLHYANTLIQDKIIFGSDWLTIGVPLETIIEEIEEWPLKESVKEKFYWKNANKLFNLEI